MSGFGEFAATATSFMESPPRPNGYFNSYKDIRLYLMKNKGQIFTNFWFFSQSSPVRV